MKIRNAVIAAGVSALLASGGFAWAAYTGQLNIIQWAGTVLGAPSNYGTSPGAVAVIGVNANVTNTNANGSAVSANSSPVVIASDQAAVAVKAASGAIASGAIADGAEVTLGAKADAKSIATDITPITIMQVLKEISAVEQAPVTRAVTNVGTFATQSAVTAASGAIASGAIASGAVASGAVASGAFASGAISDGAEVTIGTKADAKSASTDTTPITIMQVLKEISAMEQAPAGRSPYPVGATAETASATGTTAATTATLATAVGKTTYICSLSIRANATAAVTGNATVTGTITGTLNYTQWTSPLASGLGVTEQIFAPCVPASATNTAIAVVSAAPGSGGVVSVTATGYQL